MMHNFKLTIVLLAAIGVSACSGMKPKYIEPAFEQSPPKVIAVLPPENMTSNAEVEETLYPIISTRLAEKGYYVLSPEMLRAIFYANKMEEAGRINQLSPKKFHEIFGADAILRTRVTDWSSKFAVLSATVSVGLSMELYDAHSEGLLWKNSRTLSQAPNGNQGNNLLGAVINAAIHAAVVPYEPIADENTRMIYSTMPKGPYNKEWGVQQ